MSIKTQKEGKSLYKYLPLATTEQVDRLLEIIKKGQIYCCPILKLNDPMEAFIDFSDQDIREAINIQDRKNAYVCSLSKINPIQPQSVLMWTHYSRDFAGVCLEVEVREDKVNNYTCGHEVIYKKNLKEAFDELLEMRDTDRYFSTKLQFWGYEDEVRYITYDEDAEKNTGSGTENKKQKNFYLPVKVKSIRFGFNTPKHIIEMLKVWVDYLKLDIPVERIGKEQMRKILYSFCESEEE